MKVDATGNGTKAVVGVLGIVAVIAGLYAMVEPMGQRIDFIQTQLKEHRNLIVHPGGAEKLAAFQERFKEIETQFRAARQLAIAEREHLARRIATLEQGGDPRHDERIRELQRRVRELERLTRVNHENKP